MLDDTRTSAARVRCSAPLNVFAGFTDRHVTEGSQDARGLGEAGRAGESIRMLAGVEPVGSGNVRCRALFPA